MVRISWALYLLLGNPGKFSSTSRCMYISFTHVCLLVFNHDRFWHQKQERQCLLSVSTVLRERSQKESCNVDAVDALHLSL